MPIAPSTMSPDDSPTETAAPGTSGWAGKSALEPLTGEAMRLRPALRAARSKARPSDGRRPAIVSGPARLRAPMTVRVAGGGRAGWARTDSIGVASASRPPYSPIVSEIAPMLRATPSASGQWIGEPEKPGPSPVASTAGPETRTMIRATPARPRSTTSTTSTPNDEISRPRTTLSAVHCMPGRTSASGMIGSAACRRGRRHERDRESGEKQAAHPRFKLAAPAGQYHRAA